MTASASPDALRSCRVRFGQTLRDVLHSLETSGVLIVLVEDEAGRAAGVLTDGDVRRAMLKGASLTDAIDGHVQTRFTSVVPTAGRAEVLDLMQSRGLGQIPIVNEDGRFTGVHTLPAIIGARVRPNWAVLMAGGRGERLRPLTDTIPKPMIPVAGRPILERLVLHLVGGGIRRLFIAVNYLGEAIETHFGDGARFGCSIEYLRETRPLGTGGALSLLPSMPVDPLLVLNGDLLTQFDLGALLDAHARGSNVATIGVSQYTHTVPFGVVRADGDRVVALDEKPSHVWVTNAGIYVLAPEIPSRVPPGEDYSMPALIEQCLSRAERVGTYHVQDDWIDVGRRPELDRANGLQGTV